jgi:HAE1 family hydrophobic/amphiphilic exporter-1
MMIDCSVVVLENIFRRHDENHEDQTVTAVEGTCEVSMAIVASTITQMVVFLPIIFVRGVTGLLFQELAYVIIFSNICALLVSLSLVPMLASRLLTVPPRNKALRGRASQLDAAAERLFIRLDNAYRDLLYRVLRHGLATVVAAAVVLSASLLLLPWIGSEFLPPSDEGEVRVNGKMEVGTRLGLVNQQTLHMEEIVYPAVPEMVSSVASVGGSGGNPDAASEGEISLSLVPASQRERSNVEIAEDLRHRLSGKIASMEIRTRAPQGQFLLARLLGGDKGLPVEVRGFDLETLNALASRVAALIANVPGITDIDISREAGLPQYEIRVDRAKVADLNLSVRDVTKVIETTVAGSEAGEFRTQGNAYRILVQLEDVEKRSLDEILDLTLSTVSGEQVTLRNVVTVEPSRGPIVIERKDQQRLVTVEAHVAGRDMGSVARDVQALLEQIPRPVGYDLIIAGNFEEQQKSFRDLLASLVLALLLVYMVLACQYESLRDPLVVMMSVPLAATGVLLTLFLTNTTLTPES